jgi:small subunit ribosomal protein S6
MRKYELAYIVHPDLENTLDKVTEKVNKFINSHGKVIIEDIWGKRKLAYSIRKQNFGLYVITTMDLEPKFVSELEGLLRRTEEIIRYMIVSFEKEVIEIPKEQKAPKKEEEPKPKVKAKETKEVGKEAPAKETTEKEAKPKKETKAASQKEEAEPSEEERMEELDKKLKAILGDEEK